MCETDRRDSLEGYVLAGHAQSDGAPPRMRGASELGDLRAGPDWGRDDFRRRVDRRTQRGGGAAGSEPEERDRPEPGSLAIPQEEVTMAEWIRTHDFLIGYFTLLVMALVLMLYVG